MSGFSKIFKRWTQVTPAEYRRRFGLRDAMREAFQRNLISDGDQWMAMIKSRSMASHTYNQKIADEIGAQVVDLYFPLFQQFERHMQGLADAN